MVRATFGPFEFEPRSGRLTKYGLRVRLQPKSAGVLTALLEKAGEVVPREEIRSRLWPEGTFVEFDRSINVAVKRLRDALSDSSDEPTYIATVPGVGYRFIAPVTVEAPEEKPEPEIATVIPPSSSRGRMLVWASIAAVALVALSVAMYFALRRPAIPFHSRDWVLIADFDNRTGEKVLDGTLEYALDRELSNSQFAYVVPRERVQDALRLMKRPPDAKLDRATAREVSLRDGGIKAILTGRVEKLGTNYELSVQIVDPARDVAVASYTEEDPADALLAGAVRKLATRVRVALGEQVAAIQQSNERLDTVTTPSLHALQLYTQANRTIAQLSDNNSQISAELLEQALKEDPDFASAHVLLGYAYLNQGKQADAVPHFRRAFELADKTTERERYFILGSYYGHAPVSDLDKAAEIYETLLRRYPVYRWQLSNLVWIYTRMQKPEKVDDLSFVLADLRPNDARMQVLAAWNLAVREIRRSESSQPGTAAAAKPDFTRTDHYLERAIALRNTKALDAPDDLSTRIYAAQIHWMEGRFAESRADALDAERVDTQLQPGEMSMYYAAFGGLHDAEKRATDPVFRAMLAYYRGDVSSARDSLREARVAPPSWLAGTAAVLMAHAGLYREASAIKSQVAAEVSKFPFRTLDAKLLPIIDGELALQRGDTAKGIGILDKALANADTSVIWNQIAAEDVAREYRKQGKIADAIRVLERAAAGPVWPSNFSAAWQERVQMELCELYRDTGRAHDAQRIEALLAKELAFADPDHPVVRQLAALSAAPINAAMRTTSPR